MPSPARPKAVPKSKWLAYEQPLSERVRTFLRLEYLLDQAAHHAAAKSFWDSRATLSTLLEIQYLLGKGDIRSETLKEMERQAQLLSRLRNRPNVDATRLDRILESIDRFRSKLDAQQQQPGRELRESEFLANLKNRASIPGGACGFDIPGLHHWLNQPTETRNADLARWLETLDPLARALRLVTMLIRESAVAEEQTAEKGMFQMSLDTGHSCLLIRVLLPPESPCFPEISGGKHRFAIRFLTRENILERPRQTREDINFRLACCQF